MPANLLLHPKTRRRIEEFVAHPAPAILITGQPGSGKLAVALEMSAKVLGLPADKVQGYPYFIHIQRPEDKQEISIDAVRTVIREVRLKPAISGQKKVKRVLLIEDSGSLSEEAQNALLKSIEEPPDSTVFILTADSENSVLPTIASRVQKLPVAPVGAEESAAYFAGEHSTQEINSAWQLSQGAAGLLSVLLEEESDHPLKIGVEDAKKFLQQSRYERMLFLDKLASDKAKLKDFLSALSRVLAALHHSAINSNNHNRAKRMAAARRQADKASESLSLNASPRLIALSLALNLAV